VALVLRTIAASVWFRAAPWGRGLVKGAMGMVLGGTSAVELLRRGELHGASGIYH